MFYKFTCLGRTFQLWNVSGLCNFIFLSKLPSYCQIRNMLKFWCLLLKLEGNWVWGSCYLCCSQQKDRNRSLAKQNKGLLEGCNSQRDRLAVAPEAWLSKCLGSTNYIGKSVVMETKGVGVAKAIYLVFLARVVFFFPGHPDGRQEELGVQT